MAKSGRLELGDNVYRHNRSIFDYCDVGLYWPVNEFGEKNEK